MTKHASLEDKKIIELFQQRIEYAITETKIKYGNIIFAVAFRILRNNLDSEECENDTYWGIWNTIPPQIPENFKAYSLRITRNLALKKLDYNHAQKRDTDRTLSYDSVAGELAALSADNCPVSTESELTECINEFLHNLSPGNRKIFLLRYWYLSHVKEIMEECHMTKGQVESSLFRMRKKLKKHLIERRFYDE